MRVELFPFQKRALADIRMKTAEAMGSYHRTHAPQVVSFTAPTGAGKTIIMSALIEAVLFGDEQYMEQPDAIIVWLSDSPQLNEQSKQKIDSKADKIKLSQCVTVSEESFDKEVFEDGHVYFLNTQKLSLPPSSRKTVMAELIRSGRHLQILSGKRATGCTLSSMKRTVACRDVRQAKPLRSCRSSSRAVIRIAFRPCRLSSVCPLPRRDLMRWSKVHPLQFTSQS